VQRCATTLFYTGKQRVLDTAGRVAKFQQKYAKVQKKAK
jgi:large subunit ribosomal protein L31